MMATPIRDSTAIASTGLGLEYFCREGDDLWRMSDADLIALGAREIESIGLARAEEVEDGCVVRVPKAYPVYDMGYEEPLRKMKDYINSIENLQFIGRGGSFRYNNTDHSIETGLLAAKNLLGEKHDLGPARPGWSIASAASRSSPAPETSTTAPLPTKK